tara:strand:+ start:705 stop:959 length:255 start_codon:yes stop_codon:yes gene_type:complete
MEYQKTMYKRSKVTKSLRKLRTEFKSEELEHFAKEVIAINRGEERFAKTLCLLAKTWRLAGEMLQNKIIEIERENNTNNKNIQR